MFPSLDDIEPTTSTVVNLTAAADAFNSTSNVNTTESNETTASCLVSDQSNCSVVAEIGNVSVVTETTTIDTTCTNNGNNATCSNLANNNVSTERASSKYSSIEQYFQDISTQSWQKDFQIYSEFHHKSIRTIQMIGIKFPVDHKAILWCHQVLDKVTRAINVLVNSTSKDYLDFNFVIDIERPVPSASVLFANNLPSNYISFESTAKFKYLKRCHRNGYNRTQHLMKSVISPVASYIERNESLELWRNAEDREIEYIHKGFASNKSNSNFVAFASTVRTIFFYFVTSKLPLVALLYVVTSFAIASVPLLRSLAGMKGIENLSYWDRMNPVVHSSADLLIPALNYWIKIGLSFLVGNQLGLRVVTLLNLTLIGTLIVCIGFGCYHASSSPLAFIHSWSSMISILAAYCVALAVRAVGLLIIVIIRVIVSTFLQVAMTILRWTIWCRFIRRSVRAACSSTVGFICKKLNRPTITYRSMTNHFLKYRWSIFLSCLLGPLIHTTIGRVLGSTPYSLGIGTYFWCLTTLISYIFFVVLVLQVLLFPAVTVTTTNNGDGDGNGSPAQAISVTNAESVTFANEQSLMYTILIPLAWPSARFAAFLLYDTSSELAQTISILDMFGPDRITYSLAMGMVCLHLINGRNPR